MRGHRGPDRDTGIRDMGVQDRDMTVCDGDTGMVWDGDVGIRDRDMGLG